jgi:glycosyltransferase involved in cell wall biosynthesis
LTTVSYLAPDDNTGYACAAQGYIHLLRQAGVAVQYIPMRPGNTLGLWYQCDDLPGVSPAEIGVNILHAVPEYYPHLIAWLRQRGSKGPMVGMTVWETSRLPAHWPALLNALAAVVVPSEWNRDVFRQSGVTVPIHVLPHTSDFQGIPAASEELDVLRARLPSLQGRYLFYSIGAWSHRKGNDLLLRAFRRAFGSRNDVALILKTTPNSQDFSKGRWERALRRLSTAERMRRRALSGGFTNVFPITEELTRAEMRALHTLGECYVSCARGEGWGLGLYEALFYGKPCIAPDKGGHRHYLRDNHYTGLVNSRTITVRSPGANDSYRPDQQWFEISVIEAARKMQQFRSDPIAALNLAQPLSKEIKSFFSAKRIQDAMLRLLQEALPTTEDASRKQFRQVLR